MKRTHKFKALGNVAAVIASAGSISAAAKQLGVERSTIYRWMKSGAVRVASRETSQPTAADIPVPSTAPAAETWEAWVRRTFALDATEEELLGLAVKALRLAHTEEKVSDQIAAMARYQQLVRQLNLNAERLKAATPPVVAPVVRRTGTDPRAILMAVK